MKKQQIFLGIATIGGYLVKRHLDKKIATERYNGYVDAVLCESIIFLAHGAINGYNKILEAIEWLLNKPTFSYSFYKSNKWTLSCRAIKCSHLRGSRLCPTLFKKEQFGLAKVSRMQNVAELDMWKISSKNNKWRDFLKNPFRHEICALSKFVSIIYDLEYLCYLLHNFLMSNQERIKWLESNGESFGKSLKWLETYVISKSKYNLSEYDKSAHCQANLIVKYLWKIIKILAVKEIWLDEICESYSRVDLGESNAKSTKDLSAQTKGEIVVFIAQMQRIYVLITENFVENDKWHESKCIEAEKILQSFGESSKSSDSHESDLREANDILSDSRKSDLSESSAD